MIDTHCHLYDRKAFPDPAEALARARAAGVSDLVVIGIDRETSAAALALAEAHEGVWATVGVHPTHAGAWDGDLGPFREGLAHPKCVGLGEIGLDFYWDYSTPEEQFRCLEAFWDLAQETQNPVVYHCREAYAELLDFLAPRADHPHVFHCFAGDAAQAESILSRGGYLGVDGPVTYKKAEALRELVARMPREHLLVETDAPYLSPVPYRGQPNEPAYVKEVVRKVAELWGVDFAEADAVTSANARRFFGIL